MIRSRDFFSGVRERRAKRYYHEPPIRDEHGRIHVPLVSDLFASVPENMICTNSMYKELRDDIENSVDMYFTDEPITIDVFESRTSSDFNRERIQLGFRRYMAAVRDGQKRQHWMHLAAFTLFLLVGLILLIYVCDQSWMKTWLSKFAENISLVFIWQFVGYIAFEFPSEIHRIHRSAQMCDVEFDYTLWE